MVDEKIIPWILDKMNARKATSAFVLGISGAQGTGKTTLAAKLAEYFRKCGYSVATASIDDFYKTYDELEGLKKEIPEYKFRGPYGTHDVSLCYETIKKIKSNHISKISIPKFDKSLHGGMGDRLPRKKWQEIEGKIDLFIIEGWCLGPKPLNEDIGNKFEKIVNERLNDYQKIFDEIDELILLNTDSLSNVYAWRLQQE